MDLYRCYTIVTGGANGIGKEVTVVLFSCGGSVIIAVILMRQWLPLPNLVQSSILSTCDLGTRGHQLCKVFLSRPNTWDILVNCAGVSRINCY